LVVFCCFWDALMGPVFLKHVSLWSCGIAVWAFSCSWYESIICIFAHVQAFGWTCVLLPNFMLLRLIAAVKGTCRYISIWWHKIEYYIKRGLAPRVTMPVGLLGRPFVPINLMQSFDGPAHLIYFQFAPPPPRQRLLTSSGYKKKELRWVCLSKVKASVSHKKMICLTPPT
jgi:hypothetical protein